MERKIKIFVLDDDDYILEAIKRLFEQHDISDYYLFSSSIEFFASLDKDVHICVIDQKLEGMDGLDVIKKVKKINPYCYFIMLSGFDSFWTILQFDHTTLRGHFVSKNDPNFQKQVLQFIAEFMLDITMMIEAYNAMEITKDKIEKFKMLIRKDAT
jgi:DNA-binding NarL/FixJ family response regulator